MTKPVKQKASLTAYRKATQVVNQKADQVAYRSVYLNTERAVNQTTWWEVCRAVQRVDG